jgi:hypothetical protein
MPRSKKQSVKIPVSHPVEVTINQAELDSLLTFVIAATAGCGCPTQAFNRVVMFSDRLVCAVFESQHKG